MDWPHELVALPGGPRVAFAPAPEAQGVSMGIYVASGSRHESARLNGLSHFIEHLLFKGTRRRTARAIAEAVEGCGGVSDAYTQEDMTCYFARVPAERQCEVLDVLLDMVTRPRFAADDLERERQVILEEIAMYRDQPAHRAEDLLLESLWPAHPLGRPITGSERTLAGIRRVDVLRHWRRHYAPANLVLAFAGAVDRPALLAQIGRAFRGHRRGSRAVAQSAGAAARPRPFICEGRETDQCQLNLGFRAFGRRDPRRHALRMLSVLTGETTSSRLFQLIREERGWAYSVSTQIHLLSDTGYFGFEAGLDPARVGPTLRVALREFGLLARKGPGRGELRRAQDHVTGQMRLALEVPANRLAWVGEQVLFSGRVLDPDRVMRSIRQVSCEDVRRVAATYLRSSRAALVLVGPRGDQGALSAAGSIISALG